MSTNPILTDQDITIILEAIELSSANGEKVWDQEILAPIKRKIKDFSLALSEDRCCYCCKNFHGEFNMVMDIEHVLPKSKFRQYELSPFNLNVACKRCNMNIKGEDDSFIVDPDAAHYDPETTNNYRFIHPNLDNYFDHLQYDVEIRNAQKMIKYTVLNNSDKGKYTYDYFELKKLEIDSINNAQGVITKKKTYADVLPQEMVSEIELKLNDIVS